MPHGQKGRSMKLSFRWYGEGNDRIKLSDIKQIPGVEGIVWALHDKMPLQCHPQWLLQYRNQFPD